MSSKKLINLCKQSDVSIEKLPGAFMQRVSQCDLFIDLKERLLFPDPPPLLNTSENGQALRVPVKMWSACSEFEQVFIDYLQLVYFPLIAYFIDTRT